MKESLYAKVFRVFNENAAVVIGLATVISAGIALIGWYYAR